MLDIFYKNNNLIIVDSNKKEIKFDYENNKVELDSYDVTFPWEYEKSAILLEVKEYDNKLFYNFLIDGKHLVIIPDDNFEIKEDILEFFGDVDILIIKWSQASAKIFENIESKIVIPYGEAKDIFLNTLWQHIEEIDTYKQKGELPIDSTEFVNLWL